jgi:maltose O-acetyltransferase
MRSEKEKMLAGERYDPADAELVAERNRARTLCHQLNALAPPDDSRKRTLLASLFGYTCDASVGTPFHCDYGYNIRLASNVYFNVGCVLLDVMPIVIGRNALLGPGVHIYAASHPMSAIDRQSGKEFGGAVTIGDDVWIGGNAVVCPGVTVGAGCVIGAGSVVTRAIPAGVFAAGNPCRVIRSIN